MSTSIRYKTKTTNKINSSENWLETDLADTGSANTNSTDADFIDEDQTSNTERFRKTGRKPPRRRSLKNLLAENQDDYTPEEHIKFDDPGLQELFERDLLHELVAQLKSGKEATVYIARGPNGLMAAKLYVDSRVRSFKNDALYRGGRFINNARLQKAIDQRSRTGIDAQNFLWVQEEFNQLATLHQAGMSVPKPLAVAGNVVLMQFIGDEEGSPAPRLSDCKFNSTELENAFAQSLHQLGLMLGLGRVHGDYSTFNILWWQDKAIVIDFPQVVLVKDNPAATQILERDVQGLCRTFKSLGLKKDWQDVLRQVKLLAFNTQSKQGILSEPMLEILSQQT